MSIRSTFLSMIALILLVSLISGAVLASDSDPRLDFALLADVTAIGTSPTDLQPAEDELLLLQFWASWCRSCGSLMFDMDNLVSQNPGIKYIAISLDDEFAAAENYIRKHKLYEKYSDRYFIDADKQFSQSLGIESVTSILLIDGSGRVLVRKFGHLNGADFQDLVSAMRAVPR
jgi:thiol-disulfide isomerase/thioredoxin